MIFVSMISFYTVLVEGDDMNEPVADTVRGILDGHVVLTRQLADKGHYPAIDVLASVSRVMPEVIPRSHQQAAVKIKEILATFREMEDLINIGAYRTGSNSKVDRSIRLMAPIEDFLRQEVDERTALDIAREQLLELVSM